MKMMATGRPLLPAWSNTRVLIQNIKELVDSIYRDSTDNIIMILHS